MKPVGLSDNIYTAQDNRIDINGCLGFSVENIGESDATISDFTPLPAGASREYDAPTDGIFSGYIKLDFANPEAVCKILVQLKKPV